MVYIVRKKRAEIELTAPSPTGKGTIGCALRVPHDRRLHVSERMAALYADSLAAHVAAGILVPATEQ